MKLILIVILVAIMFGAGWMFRGSKDENTALRAIEESASNLGDRILENTLNAQEAENKESRTSASDQLSLLLLGRSLVAEDFFTTDSIESFTESSSQILQGFRLDFEAGVDYGELQPVAAKLYADMNEIQSEVSTPLAPASLTP